MLYGREGWDPKRIVTQILMMQLLHYGSGVVVLGVLWAVAGVSFHERVLFAWDEMRLDSVDGWGAVVCALLSAAARCVRGAGRGGARASAMYVSACAAASGCRLWWSG
jgi:Integral membrane protein S linking to the trans Golgi network